MKKAAYSLVRTDLQLARDFPEGDWRRPALELACRWSPWYGSPKVLPAQISTLAATCDQRRSKVLLSRDCLFYVIMYNVHRINIRINEA